jgi:hypothetical protein
MANTANLNLAKPAGTDKALVSVLNSNSDKIDAWAGTTNQALSNVEDKLSYVSDSVSDLNTLSVGSMGRVTLAAGVSPTGGAINVQYVCMGESARKTIIACVVNTTRTFVNTALNNTWLGWQELALKNDIAIVTASVAGGGGTAIMPFPSGFSRDNCYAISVSVSIFGYWYYSESTIVLDSIGTDGIHVRFDGATSDRNGTVRVVLRKL